MKYTDDNTGLFKSEDLMLHEALTAYGGTKKQGEYTIEDYYALPDKPRMELIDGVLYAMGAPSIIHQEISGALYLRFCQYIQKKKGKCRTLISPCDVQLNCDNRTMVQPDVMIICERDKLNNLKTVYGTPDFIVEVLSPSSRNKDVQIKTRKYRDAGVREYWMIDPMNQRIVVHNFESGQSAIYGFTDQLPVAIFHGELIVDFEEISTELDSIYETGYSTLNKE